MTGNIEGSLHVPGQRFNTLFSKDAKEQGTLDIVGCMLKGRAVLMQNGAVWAIMGDASNPAFLEEVNTLKERDSSRTYGLMCSFERVLPWVDVSRVNDPRIIDLLMRPDAVTELLGGLGFLRLPVDEEKVRDAFVPDSVLSWDENGKNPVMQVYDPTGKDDISSVYKTATDKGVDYIAITSANKSEEPEITRNEALRILKFVMAVEPIAPLYPQGATGHEYPIFEDRSKEFCGDGSYFIIGVEEKDPTEPHALVDSGGFTLLREGNIDTCHIQQLLAAYGLQVGPYTQPRKLHYTPYRSEDLNNSLAVGSIVRQYIIEDFGWQNEQA